MTIGLVTYPGIVFAKGATYTQTRGVEPDSIALRLIPQTSVIAAVGNIVMKFGDTDIITIPDCLADKSNVWLNEKGFTGTVIFQDRRWRWSRAQSYDWHVNERDILGDIIAASKYSLRAIFQDLFAWIGEANVDVSRVNDAFCPELDLTCVQVDETIADLCSLYGYEVCLGFSDDPVEVWPLGTGRSINTTVSEVMRISTSVDPSTNPQYSQVCFGALEAQARFLAIPVGLERDGTIKKINALSYRPSLGWEFEDPRTFNNVASEHGVDEARLAEESVFKWYLIEGFADGVKGVYPTALEGKSTMDYPDGSGTLTHLNQLYPFLSKLISPYVDATTQNLTYPPVVVYGKCVSTSPAWVGPNQNQWVDEEISGNPFSFDRYIGLIKFEKPLYQFDPNPFAGKIHPAIVYIEAAFRIRDIQTRQFISYVNTLEVDPSGFGYKTHRLPRQHSVYVTEYDENQEVADTGGSNNDSLDEDAAVLHAATAGLYNSSKRLTVHYNKPMQNARCDGLTSQVQHVISDGTGGRFSGHHTVISQSMDFDAYIRGAVERKQSRHVARQLNSWIVDRMQNRSEKANG